MAGAQTTSRSGLGSNSGPGLSRRVFVGSAGAAASLVGWPRFAAAAGGVAILAIDSDPETLNPGLTTGYAAGDVAAKIFDGLVWVDPDGEPQPSLAASWEITDDGKTYTFHLRDGVVWHDGAPFTAEDVAYTFNEVLAKAHPRTSTTLKRLEAVAEAVDAGTVTIKLKTSFALFLRQLWVFDAPILPRHIFEGTDLATNPASQNPVGTGPFKFGSWDRGASLRVARNQRYWRSGKPLLDEVVFQIVPQAVNRTAGLETGEIDLVLDFYLAKPDVPRLQANSDLKWVRGRNVPAIYFMTINTKRPMFADAQARQALAFAIDRDRLVTQAMNGLARPGYGAFGDGFKWLLNEEVSYPKLYPLDPGKAKELLRAAGVEEGARVTLTYDAARPQLSASAQIVRENLSAIGLQVQLEALERSVVIQKVFKDRDFDLTLQSYFSSGDPAIGCHRLYLTNETGQQFTNASGYSNPEVDRLLAEAATAPSRPQRAERYRELQAILNVDLPSLVLFDEDGIDFATKRLKGIWVAQDTRERFDEVSLEG